MKHEEPFDHRSARTPLANLLIEGRLASGLNQKQAALRMRISAAYLNRLENGSYFNPSLRVMNAAAEAYQLPRADLFAAAGQITPSDLPTLEGYLRATCIDLPSAAISEMVQFCEYVKDRYRQALRQTGGSVEKES